MIYIWPSHDDLLEGRAWADTVYTTHLTNSGLILAIIGDSGPTIQQHWVNVWCFHGYMLVPLTLNVHSLP